MAIVKSLPGFKVMIVVDGAPLTEYIDDSEPDEDRTTMRYIEAVSNQVFEIHIRAEKSAEIKGDALVARLYVDGKSTGGPMISKGKNKYRDHNEVRKGPRASSNTVREFCFSSIDTAHDKRALNGEKELLKELGSIRVELYFVHKHSRSKQTGVHNIEDLGIVSEKALVSQDRPISHSVGFKPAVRSPGFKKWKTSKIDNEGEKNCSFVFRYASKSKADER